MLTTRATSRWRKIPRLSQRCLYATTGVSPQAPPLLLKLKADLKSAMKARDTNRLNVLRAIIAETTNASKTNFPIKTDLQLLSLLRKRASASKLAAEEFSTANRKDLEEKEMAQITVLEEYASEVKTVGEDDIKDAVSRMIGEMRTDGQQVNIGTVSKALLGPGGELESKPVEKAELAKAIKGML